MRNHSMMVVALCWVAVAAGCQPPPSSQTAPPTDAMDRPVSPADGGAADSANRDAATGSRPRTTEKQAGADADAASSVQYDPDTGDESVKEPERDSAPEPEQVTRKKAQGGVGKRGQGYGGGAVSEPARQYFQIRERIVFQVQVPQALNAYKALEGRGPQSHEEFMEKVIKANGLTLPELPPGLEYQYDPETEELMVVGTRQ